MLESSSIKTNARRAAITPLLFSLTFGITLAIDDYGPIMLEELASGLSRPIYVTTPPADNDRLFVVEQTGTIVIFDRDSDEVNSQPFLDISSEIPSLSGGDERGLLGLAFHPEYGDNGYFYIYFTNIGGNTVIRRYEVSSDPDEADTDSAQTVLTFNQPFGNHNGGWMGFGPDGYLYIASGDGGAGNDPQNHGQNTGTLLGAMLRIDVDGDDFPAENDRNYAIPEDNPFVEEDGRDEIWAYGLRNPWRASFDRETGDLWIADVGQNTREEINFQPAASTGGENYGWRLREGTIATPTGGVGGPRPPGNVDPIHEYSITGTGGAIIGGFVYRGEAMPQLQGMYFYADWVLDFVESLRYDGETVTEIIDWTPFFTGRLGNLVSPTSFGEDPDGELYLTTLDNRLYRLTQRPWFLWRNRHFTEEQIADPAVSGDAATPAGDGIFNLMKYALGIPPLEPGHPLPVETEVRSVGGDDFLTMTIARNPDAQDIAFIVESSGDLGQSDPWSEDTTVVVEDTDELLVVRDVFPLDDENRRFIRLRLVRTN